MIAAFSLPEFAGLLVTAIALAIWGLVIVMKWNGEL